MALVEQDMGTVTTRAVERLANAGERYDCAHCGTGIGFEATKRNRQIIANVYVREDSRGRLKVVPPGQYGGRWDRVEHWHTHCYADQADPYGEPEVSIPVFRHGQPAKVSGKR